METSELTYDKLAKSRFFPKEKDLHSKLDKPFKTPELTHQRLWKLAPFIQTEEDIDLLAGYLGIPPFEIKKHLEAELNIRDAIYKTFRSWFNQQPDRTSAYRNMCEALKKADMIHLIKVLE